MVLKNSVVKGFEVERYKDGKFKKWKKFLDMPKVKDYETEGTK